MWIGSSCSNFVDSFRLNVFFRKFFSGLFVCPILISLYSALGVRLKVAEIFFFQFRNESTHRCASVLNRSSSWWWWWWWSKHFPPGLLPKDNRFGIKNWREKSKEREWNATEGKMAAGWIWKQLLLLASLVIIKMRMNHRFGPGRGDLTDKSGTFSSRVPTASSAARGHLLLSMSSTHTDEYSATAKQYSSSDH